MGKHGLPATQLSNIANTFKFVGKATYRAKIAWNVQLNELLGGWVDGWTC